MRALVIAHDHLSSAGRLSSALAAAGYDLVTHLVVPAARFDAPDVRGELPELAGFDLVVSLGAPWSVYDTVRIPWSLDEQAYLRAADAAGVPVLGVCFGGQLLAAAHGGRVARNESPEIGWHDVDADEDGVVESAPWFQWHFDAWTVPPGAREIARNARASQAFTLRRNLAVQFHPEVDDAILKGWLDHGGAGAARRHGLDPDELIARTIADAERAQAQADRLVRRFLDEVAYA